MRFSSRTWSLISLALFAGAILCFWLDQRLRSTAGGPGAAATSGVPAEAGGGGPGQAGGVSTQAAVFPLLSPGAMRPVVPAAAPVATGFDREHGFRLVNTTLPMEQLSRRDTAILLDNAFLDAEGPVRVEVPEHLRAGAEPGGWLVQTDRPLDRAMYDALEAAGVSFVAYVPHNTALVRGEASRVKSLRGLAGVRQVLPFEPAYKLSRGLVPLAVEQEPLPADAVLKVLGYPGRAAEVAAALEGQGAEILMEDGSPFGPVYTVRLPEDGLARVAVLGEVQRVEAASARVLLNDRTRVRFQISEDQATNGTYLDLTGEGVLLNANDSGVDTNHVGLAGRVTVDAADPAFGVDEVGHGTHVVGIMVGSGAGGESATNVQGSLTNSLFSGMAPKAKVHVLPVDRNLGPLVSDVDLQRRAAEADHVKAGGTNVLISNNSWAYRGAYEYDLAAATYDAAVRDALPDRTGSQPLLFVFAAGNEGFGGEEGLEGFPDSISSPATAKNVITVGALEQLRDLTNFYTLTNSYFLTNVVGGTTTVELVEVVTTNYPFASATDSDTEVASFSSRGNVGVGREGKFGRYKPDLVAPGTFLVSARSAAWALTNTVATNAVDYPMWTNLVEECGTNYMYESGTSMSAASVSGLLALMQEFFEARWQRPCPPALLKALVINGARPVGLYDYSVVKYLNHQGWGVPNLTNSLPAALTNTTAVESHPMRYFADPKTNVLGSGHVHRWLLTLDTNEDNGAHFLPIRVTLAWTDPPGNPNVALKLVNDLDLVVENLDTGDVFIGNHFPRGSVYTTVDSAEDPLPTDNVNNVENVYVPPPTGGTNYRYGVSVYARRVNVNAVTENLADVVQDYALVISAGGLTVTNPIASLEWQQPGYVRPAPMVPTNGLVMTKQRAGANFQLASNPAGVTNQWTFYVFTNRFDTNMNFSGYTNGSNVAFVVNSAANLSRSRNIGGPDVDLYVSTNKSLLDLDPVVLQGAYTSRKRGGSEQFVLTNATTNDIFYVGVKAEDQQAVQYNFLILSTDESFNETDEFGNVIVRFTPLRSVIPDGSPDNPGGQIFTGVSTVDAPILKTYAFLDMVHESMGDLQGIMSQGQDYVVLHNHNPLDGYTNVSLIYDDEEQPPNIYGLSRPSDGPGSLENFMAHNASDSWVFVASDDASGATGNVQRVEARFTPHPPWENGGITLTVPGLSWRVLFIDVPLGATAMRVTLDPIIPALPMELYLRQGQPPTFTAYDKRAVIPGSGGSLTLSVYDVPPLNPGLCFIGLYNPNFEDVKVTVTVEFEFDLTGINRGGGVSTNTPARLRDDAVTRSSIEVNDRRTVTDMMVGLRVEHPRVSDLDFHLIDPNGTRIMLAENRGGVGGTAFGATLFGTNLASINYSGGPAEFRTNIATGVVQGRATINYEFYTVPDSIRVYYEGRLMFDTGLISGAGTFTVFYGPGVSTDLTVVVNEGGSTFPTTRWDMDAVVVYQKELYTMFTERTNLQPQLLKFSLPPYTNSPLTLANTNRLVFEEDFERYPAGRYVGGLIFGPWEVGPGDVVIHGPTNPVGGVAASSGTNYLELPVEGEPSGIATELGTVRGSTYRTQFDVRENNVYANSPQSVGLFVDGVLVKTVRAVRGGGWTTAEVEWRADRQRARVELRTLAAAGPLVDQIQIFEVIEGGEAYFLPEENMLKPLGAAPAFGTWTLEVTDSRAGALQPVPPTLLSWTLSFVFANTNPPATLLRSCTPESLTVADYASECTLRTNVLSGAEVKYFAVEVPLAAGHATNEIVSAGDLVVWFNQDGLPTGQRYTDYTFDTAGPGEAFVLATNGIPPLVPGQRYYLGVSNRNPAETNSFTIAVTFDAIDAVLPGVPVLTNGVPVNTNAPAGPTNLPPGSVMQYYQFPTTSNATHVVFGLDPSGYDLDLYARLERPVRNPLPRPNPGYYDYASTNAGGASEEIVITRRSLPVGLEPETPWYLAVRNMVATNVNYTIVAHEYTDLLTLRSGVAAVRSVEPGLRLQYSEYEVGPFATNLLVTCSVTGTNPVNLYVRRLAEGPQPLPQPRTNMFDYRFAVPAGGTLTTNIDVGSRVPLVPGTWYFGVENPATTTNNYTLTVLEQGELPATIVPLANGVALPWSLLAANATATYFLFDVATVNPSVLFEVYDVTRPVEVFLAANGLPDPLAPQWIATGSPAAPAQIVLRTSSGTPADLRASWYLLVRPQAPGDVDFTVRAVLSSGGILISGVPLNVGISIGPGGEASFTWNTVPGEKYEVQVSTDLVAWTTVTTITATGATASWTDPDPPGGPMKFYKIIQVP